MKIHISSIIEELNPLKVDSMVANYSRKFGTKMQERRKKIVTDSRSRSISRIGQMLWGIEGTQYNHWI